MGNLHWRSVEPGLFFIYTLDIAQIGGTLESLWDVASSCHWNSLWGVHCSKKEGKSLPAHLYARKTEGSVAGRRQGVSLRKAQTSLSSSKICAFFRSEVCGHFYGKNYRQLCRVNSGEFLCTTGVDTQKKEIFKKLEWRSYCIWFDSSTEFLKLHGSARLQSTAEVISNSRKKNKLK